MNTSAVFYERPIVEVLTTMESFLDRLFPATFQSSLDWRAAKLKEFIDHDPSKIRGNLDAVCKELDLALSDRHARRVFALSAGLGVNAYARNKCLERAARQLQTTTMPVKVVAANAGFQHTRNFARSFEEMFRAKPTEFRKIWGRKME